jgi:hypothetical protein
MLWATGGFASVVLLPVDLFEKAAQSVGQRRLRKAKPAELVLTSN